MSKWGTPMFKGIRLSRGEATVTFAIILFGFLAPREWFFPFFAVMTFLSFPLIVLFAFGHIVQAIRDAPKHYREDDP